MVERSFFPERILVIRLGAIGDLLCSTPVVTNLRKNYPQSHIVFLVEKKFEEVLIGNPHLDELILFDRPSHRLSLRWWRRGATRSNPIIRLIEELKFLIKIRHRRFDLTIDLLGTLRTALLSFVSGAKQRVGFTYRFRKLFYNIRVVAKNPQYVVDFNLDSLRALGLKIMSKDLVFNVPESSRRFAKDFFRRGEVISPKVGQSSRLTKNIGIFPGGGWSSKRWRGERYAKLGDKIQKELDCEVILLGGPQEKGVLSEIASRMNRKPMILEGVSLKKFAGVVENLDLLIGNDSGPIYIAIALKVPTITLFGPTDSKNATPPDGKHIAISKNHLCRNPNAISCILQDCCIQSITVEEVLEKVREVLKNCP